MSQNPFLSALSLALLTVSRLSTHSLEEIKLSRLLLFTRGEMNRLLLLCAVLTMSALWAQTFNASIRGVVTDKSQAAVPSAKITVTEVSRNLGHTAVTDGSGRYHN